MNIESVVRENLIGKKLVGLQFGANEEGNRSVNFGQLIRNAEVCYNGEDVIIDILLEDMSTAYAFIDEDIEIEDNYGENK